MKFIINLDIRPDRIAVTIPKLKQFGFNDVQRFRAIPYNENLLEYVHKDHIQPILDEKRTNHNQLSKGAIGCYLSHIELYKQIQKGEYDYGIIFEDDVLPSNTLQKVEKEMELVPIDWDIILIGGAYKKDNTSVSKVGRFFQTHAYIIKKSSIEKILSNAFPIKYQIDSYLSDMSEADELMIYGLNNMNWTVDINIADTNIQTICQGC